MDRELLRALAGVSMKPDTLPSSVRQREEDQLLKYQHMPELEEDAARCEIALLEVHKAYTALQRLSEDYVPKINPGKGHAKQLDQFFRKRQTLSHDGKHHMRVLRGILEKFDLLACGDSSNMEENPGAPSYAAERRFAASKAGEVGRRFKGEIRTFMDAEAAFERAYAFKVKQTLKGAFPSADENTLESAVNKHGANVEQLLLSQMEGVGQDEQDMLRARVNKLEQQKGQLEALLNEVQELQDMFLYMEMLAERQAVQLAQIEDDVEEAHEKVEKGVELLEKGEENQESYEKKRKEVQEGMDVTGYWLKWIIRVLVLGALLFCCAQLIGPALAVTSLCNPLRSCWRSKTSGKRGSKPSGKKSPRASLDKATTSDNTNPRQKKPQASGAASGADIIPGVSSSSFLSLDDQKTGAGALFLEART